LPPKSSSSGNPDTELSNDAQTYEKQKTPKPPKTSEIESVQFFENPKMRIPGYPSFDKPPQYYIDRYYNEPTYRDWFDSQFPKKTIYDVLGFSTYVPEWIKTYAENWASGEISDHEFIIGLEFMLDNRIIVIPNFDYSLQQSIDDIPSWFRNTAHWWATDLISQQEFINSIKYLIQEDIILIE
jgi:hypothetical protein